VAVTNDHSTDDALSRATRLLRQHTDAGWTEVRGDILDRALRAFRPSEPVRGRHDLGDFFVAADVVVTRLRQAVDEVPLAAAARITCSTDEQQELDGVTIEILAAYGARLIALADEVHATAAQTLTEILGDLAPSAGAIHTHVHIADITDDPRDVL
jgi:hypothetical protein